MLKWQRLSILILLILFSLGAPSYSIAQLRNDYQATIRQEITRREAYLKEFGLYNRYLELRKMVSPEVEAKNSVKKNAFNEDVRDYKITMAIQELAVKYSLDEVRTYKQDSIDLVNDAIFIAMPQSEKQFMALLEEAFVGRIVRAYSDSSPGDGYRSTIVVEVDEWLLGGGGADTVLIRQVSGRAGSGWKGSTADVIRLTQAGEFTFPTFSHLFTVSSTKYGLSVATSTGKTIKNPRGYRVLYIDPIPVSNGGLIVNRNTWAPVIPKSMSHFKRRVLEVHSKGGVK